MTNSYFIKDEYEDGEKKKAHLRGLSIYKIKNLVISTEP
jgi:hypothetical protein